MKKLVLFIMCLVMAACTPAQTQSSASVARPAPPVFGKFDPATTKDIDVSALPVLAEPAAPFLPPSRRNQDWLFVTELKKSYEVVPVALDADEVEVMILVMNG